MTRFGGCLGCSTGRSLRRVCFTGRRFVRSHWRQVDRHRWQDAAANVRQEVETQGIASGHRVGQRERPDARSSRLCGEVQRDHGHSGIAPAAEPQGFHGRRRRSFVSSPNTSRAGSSGISSTSGRCRRTWRRSFGNTSAAASSASASRGPSCGNCGHDFVVAFSCKGRGVCPSCNGRRMAQTAAHTRLSRRAWQSIM